MASSPTTTTTADFWDTAKGVLGAVAPTIATALGGPLAGIAVGALTKAIGLAPDSSQATLASAIAGATPDQLLAIKRAENEFQETMTALEVSRDKLTYDDRANARGRQAGTKDSTPTIMGYIILAGTIGL
jgi:hypothetical protein